MPGEHPTPLRVLFAMRPSDDVGERVAVREGDVTVDVSVVTDVESAANVLREDPEIDCVVTRHDLADGTGIDVYDLVGEYHPSAPVVLLVQETDGTVPSAALDRDFDVRVSTESGTPDSDRLGEAIGAALFGDGGELSPPAFPPDCWETDDWKASVLDQLFEKLPLHVFLKDGEARITKVTTGPIASRVHPSGDSYLGERDIDGVVRLSEALDPYLDDLRVLSSGVTVTDKEEHFGSTEQWVRTTKVPLHDENDDVVGLAGLSQDITDQKEYERQLRQNEKRYRTLVEMSPDAIFVHVDGEIVYANQAMAELLESKVSELRGTSISEYVDLERHGDVDEIARRTQEGQYEPTNRPYRVHTRAENERFVETTSRPIAYEDEAAVLTIAKDVTERHRHEALLTQLHESAREMARQDSREAIVTVAVDAFVDILGFDGAVFYEFDGSDAMEPIVWSDAVAEHADEIPAAERGSGFVWDVFAEGEDRFWPTIQGAGTLAHDLPLQATFALPIDNHGVLVAGSMHEHSLSNAQRELGHLIMRNLTAALDGNERDRELTERDRELARQNRSLEQLNRLNDIIRETNRSVLNATSRTEIEAEICADFSDRGVYSFAWLAGRSAGEDRFHVQAWSGMDAEFADYLDQTDRQTPLHDLVRSAFSDGSLAVVTDVLDAGDEWADHRREALNHDYRSIAAVPITVDGRVENVLVIHAKDSGVFDDREERVLAEMGQTIGAAIRNVERLTALQTDERTEIDVEIRDERLFTNRIAARIVGSVELVGIIEAEAETIRAFVRVDVADHASIEEQLGASRAVHDVVELATDEDRGLYQLTLETPTLFTVLQRNDAQVRSLTATPDATKLTAVLRGGDGVRAVVDALRDHYPETELSARRENAEPVETRETFRDRLVDELTEKQLDALKTALYGGFYEWPRASTSEELAATRGIAGSTFQYHLRSAERKFISAVLDSW